MTRLWSARLWLHDHRTTIWAAGVITGALVVGVTVGTAARIAAAAPQLATALLVAAGLGLHLVVVAMTPRTRSTTPPPPPGPRPDDDAWIHPRSTA